MNKRHEIKSNIFLFSNISNSRLKLPTFYIFPAAINYNQIAILTCCICLQCNHNLNSCNIQYLKSLVEINRSENCKLIIIILNLRNRSKQTNV